MTSSAAAATRAPAGAQLAADRHGMATTVVLHLAPGVALAAAALPLGRLAMSHGLPPAAGLLGASVLVLIPVQLGLIAVAARRRTGSWRLRGALGYTRRLPARVLAGLGLATLVWAGLAFTLTAPVGGTLHATLFGWWPAALDYTAYLADPERYTRGLLLGMWAAGLLVTTLAAPIVEELYFRGFLLPRLEHLGRWAPVLNTMLFALYHAWSPWQVPTRIAATLPLYYATWRTRSIWLAIAVHVALNLIGDTIPATAIVFGL